jgi:hypothetical protein
VQMVLFPWNHGIVPHLHASCSIVQIVFMFPTTYGVVPCITKSVPHYIWVCSPQPIWLFLIYFKVVP